MERLAVRHATRGQKRRRNRRIGIVGGVLVVIVGILLAIFVGPASNDDNKKSAATTVPPTTAAPLKRCVGLKDALPKGAPSVPIAAGAAPTRLVTKDIKVGTGAVVPKGAPKVAVNYVGVLCSTGKVFDSSYSRNQPFDANLASGVIKGWQEGVPGMKAGGVRLLEIPPDLAYGAAGQPPTIPENEALFFIVSVVGV